MGQTVNLLSLDFGGSNPSSPTQVTEATKVVLVLSLKFIKESFRGKVAGIAQLIEH